MPAVTSDDFPTILQALGIKWPERPYAGISLLPLINRDLSERSAPIGFPSK